METLAEYEQLTKDQPIEVILAYLEAKGDLAEWVAENGEAITKAKEKADSIVLLQKKVDEGKLAEVELAKVELAKEVVKEVVK